MCTSHCSAAIVWACNLSLLLAARLGKGFRFASLGRLLAPLDNHRCMDLVCCLPLCHVASTSVVWRFRLMYTAPPVRGVFIVQH